MWAFVARGLYKPEQRLAAPVIVSSVFFFALGMSFAYFAVFPIAFGFFANYTPVGVQMMTDIDKYLSFVLTMFIAFGITFEVPVVVIVLVRLGVVKLETLRSIRGYVVVGAFVVGAIFTPPDILSQVMLAVPLWLLFELGLLVARFISLPARDQGAAAPGISADGLTWPIRIKPGINFPDDRAFRGKPRELVAEDYVYSFKRALDPNLRGGGQPIVPDFIIGMRAVVDAARKPGAKMNYDTPVEGLRALDRYTLQIRLNEPNFPEMTVQLVDDLAVAREVVDAAGGGLPHPPGGTGAYSLEK